MGNEQKEMNSSPKRSSLVPQLVTSVDKETQCLNASGSESDGSEELSKSPSMALVIRTSDLTSDKPGMSLQIRPPGSPPGLRSPGFFSDAEVPRSMAYRPKNQIDYGSSPPQIDGLPVPGRKLQSTNDRFGTSPRPESLRLAPDQNGNEIPADAKWTRIRRSLVSTEVLDQDRRRYEA